MRNLFLSLLVLFCGCAKTTNLDNFNKYEEVVPFSYPCEYNWIEGQPYVMETISKIEDCEIGEECEILNRRMCLLNKEGEVNGAWTAVIRDKEKGWECDGEFVSQKEMLKKWPHPDAYKYPELNKNFKHCEKEKDQNKKTSSPS